MANEWFIQNGANSGVGRAAIQLGMGMGHEEHQHYPRTGQTQVKTEQMKKELLGLGATQVITEEELMARDFRDKVKEMDTWGPRRDQTWYELRWGKRNALANCEVTFAWCATRDVRCNEQNSLLLFLHPF